MQRENQRTDHVISFGWILLFSILLSSCSLQQETLESIQKTESLLISQTNLHRLSLERNLTSKEFFLNINIYIGGTRESTSHNFLLNNDVNLGTPQWSKPILVSWPSPENPDVSILIIYRQTQGDRKTSLVEWILSTTNGKPDLQLHRIFIVPIPKLLPAELSINKDNILTINSPGTEDNPHDRIVLSYEVSTQSNNLNPIKILRRRN